MVALDRMDYIVKIEQNLSDFFPFQHIYVASTGSGQ